MAKSIQFRKLPPFGKALAERQRFKNLPDFVFIFCGARAWDEAKSMQTRSDVSAMVLPVDVKPAALVWPVANCICIVSWNTGPAEELIIELARALFNAGAEMVVVWPRWPDYKQSGVTYDETQPIGQRWIPARESIKVYKRGGRAA